MKNQIEKRLQMLFDYQSFENNPELLKLKQQTEALYTKELNDEDLLSLNAAGDFNMQNGTVKNRRDSNASARVPHICEKCSMVFFVKAGAESEKCPYCGCVNTLS